MKKFFKRYNAPKRSETFYYAFFSIYAFLIVTTSVDVFAQSGITGLQNATTEVTKYFDQGTKLMYAIGAIVGIVGAIKVFNKFNSGDNDTGKVASAWLGSCIFLIVVSAILRGFFIG